MRNRSIWTVLLAVIAMSLALTGCGDDDSSDDDAPADNAAEDTSDDGADDAASDQGSADEDPAVDPSDLDFDLDGDCAFLANFATGIDEAFDPSAVMTDGGDAYAGFAEQFREVADAAPDEIKDAFETMADGMDQFAEAFSGVDLSDPANIDPEALESLENLGNGPGEEFEAASAEIEAWINQNCADAG